MMIHHFQHWFTQSNGYLSSVVMFSIPWLESSSQYLIKDYKICIPKIMKYIFLTCSTDCSTFRLIGLGGETLCFTIHPKSLYSEHVASGSSYFINYCYSLDDLRKSHCYCYCQLYHTGQRDYDDVHLRVHNTILLTIFVLSLYYISTTLQVKNIQRRIPQ